MLQTTETTPEVHRDATTPRAVVGRPVRVAIIGCGAVAQQFHIPVLAGHEGVTIAAFVDRDLSRARGLADAYGVGQTVADAAELADGSIDAALVATPPSQHAPCAIALARRGVHVLVEKPMARSSAEAEAMVRAAEESGVVLAVGLFRRLLPASRMLRALIEAEHLGRPVGFRIEAGSFYGWPAATLGNMRRDLAGGGVLIDMGTHVIDQLLFVLPGPVEVLEYRDNSLGGIESDCRLRLRVHYRGEPVEGTIALGRARVLGNAVRIECERGRLDLPFGENDRVSIRPRDLEFTDALAEAPRPCDLQAAWSGGGETIGYEAFRIEFDDWLDAIRAGRPPRLSGRSALPTVRLIDECYRAAGVLRESWVEEGIGPVRRGPTSDPAEVGRWAPAALHRHKPRRVLITGASGFIGGRVAEILHLQEGCEVRAIVHNPGNAARLARLPVEMIQADLKSPDDLVRAVEGCDAVVHCAIGTAYGQRREIFDITEGGTRRLVDACRDAGVRRLIHLSSIAIHGNDVTGVLDEDSPIRPLFGDEYSESKAAAERVVAQAARAGLPSVVLRPGNVYGPYSRTFSVRPIEYLAQGRLLLVGSADTSSNTVYIDNLVHAILRALDAPEEVADGRAFTIGEGDELTWGEFYGYFARALGVELRTAPLNRPDTPTPGGRGPIAWSQAWWRGGMAIATSPEFRAFGRRVLETDPIGRLPRGLLERFPAIDHRLRRALGVDAANVYRRPAADGPDLMEIRPRPAQIRIDRARADLGYDPPVSRSRALELTLAWIRAAGIA